MAAIYARTKKNGETVYDCIITVRRHGVIVHRQKKTFRTKKLATDWGKRREVELQTENVYKTKPFTSIRSVIEGYIKEYDPTGRSKLFDLKKLLKRDIADKNANTLTARDLIQHIKSRNDECQPQTAVNDLVWLHAALKAMKPLLDLDTDLSIFDSAREILYNNGLIARSVHRERIPTKEELWKLSRHFNTTMRHIMWFAIFSARRQSEITKLRWEDFDRESGTIWVRDLKNPRVKGLKKKAKLPRSAVKLILRQPQNGDLIFPYNSKTIGSYFTRACKVLEINDLHFHDLRHYAMTRLAMSGLGIHQMMLVSLHTNIATLTRYVNMKAEDVKI